MSCDYVTSSILNERDEERTVVSVWTSHAYAKHYRHGWDSRYLEQLRCMDYHFGAHLLARLAQKNADIVIDHGHQGIIVSTAVWRPVFECYGQIHNIALPDKPDKNWRPADPDDFPVWRDRLTSLLRNVGHIRMAWLLWVPAAPDNSRRLCLVTASYDADRERLHQALPILAQDLTLPLLAYLPLCFGDPRLNQLPDDAPMLSRSKSRSAAQVRNSWISVT